MHRLTNWRKCIILIFVRRFLRHRPIDGLWTSRGCVVSNIESYHLFASVICVNAVYRHSAAVGHFILHILKMFPNNSWCFNDVLAMICFNVSRHHESRCFQGNMAAITRSSGCVTLTFNSSWTRPRKYTTWITQSRKISDYQLMESIRLIIL